MASFGYDNLDRLTQAVIGSTTYSYEYDLNGNRTQRILSGAGSSATTYSYPATSNRLQSVQVDSQAAQAITTDETGNITVDPANPVGTVNYAYTTGEGVVVTGRLTHSYGPMARHIYSHNGLGQRTRKVGSTLTSGGVTYSPPAYVGSSDTYFHYDQSGQLIAERDANQLVKREYIWLYGQPVAVITGATPTQPVRTTGTPLNQPQVRYVHADHLNTPRLITDTAGAKRWEWSVLSEPFGIAAANGAPQAQTSAQRLDFHLRFPGQYFDQETATAYNYFRTYSPNTGRYTQSDPIGLNGGTNTFAYTENQPISFTDPRGLVKWSGNMTAAAGIAGLGAGGFFFDLTSECKCGIRIRIKGYASTVAAGLGMTYTGSRAAAEFTDVFPCPKDNIANGPAGAFGVSSVGGVHGRSWGGMRMGSLKSSPSVTKDVAGLDLSAGIYLGWSVVTSAEQTKCEDCETGQN